MNKSLAAAVSRPSAAGARFLRGRPKAAAALLLAPRGWLAASATVSGTIRFPAAAPDAITAQIVQARAVAASFGRRDLGGHSLKRRAPPAWSAACIRPSQAAL
jgi:hypothetical protein